MRGLVAGLILLLPACSSDSEEGGGTGSTEDAGSSETTPSGSGSAGTTGETGTTGTTTAATSTAGTTSQASTSGTSETETSTTSGPPEVALPPADAGLDYQLGGAYPPPDGVQIVSRDRNDPPAAGLYNICYVNGYQTQPDEEQWWLDEHPDLLLRDGDGEPFIDPDWDEILLDIRTAELRAALAEIVGGWIVQCAEDGFDAVEIDNLDTYSRSDGLISQDNAVEFMTLLSSTAHDVGLAIAQKNSAEIVSRRDDMGTDFVVAEECNRWNECQDYIDAYDGNVLVIEYRMQDFTAGCSDYPDLSIVLRDLQLVPEGTAGYVFDGC